MSTSVYTGLNPFNFIRKHFLQICVRKVAIHLGKVLEVMSTGFDTGLNRTAPLPKCTANALYFSERVISPSQRSLYIHTYLNRTIIIPYYEEGGIMKVPHHWNTNLCYSVLQSCSVDTARLRPIRYVVCEHVCDLWTLATNLTKCSRYAVSFVTTLMS
jgi:hypothetical protein